MFNNLFFKKSYRVASKKTKTAYTEILASSLVLYAKIDEKFADEFKRMIKMSKMDRVNNKSEKITKLSLFLAPPDTMSAYKRAEWLIGGLEKERSSKSEPALSLMFDFVNDRPISMPHQLVIGLAGIAVPGITLGKISRRKMNIIVSKDFILKSARFEFAEKTASACTGILAESLKKAGAKTKQLEPDMAEWFFGDRNMSFFSASEKELAKIEKDLGRSENIYNSAYSDNKLAVIALSPAFNSLCVENTWKIDLINENNL